LSERKTHPIYELLTSKVALQNNPELIECLGNRIDAQVVLQLAYLQAHFKHKGGWFFRKQSVLVAELGMSESTLRRSLKRLKSRGLVQAKRKRLERNRSKSVNFYRVDLGLLQGLLDEQQAKHALISANLVPDMANSESAPNEVQDQSVKMTGSILEIYPNTAEPTPSVKTRNQNGASLWCRYSRQMQILESRYPSDEPEVWGGFLDTSLGKIRDIASYGYDDKYNPFDPRFPEPGQPEELVRQRIRDVSEYVLTWLRTEALKRPFRDIETAVDMAQKDLAESVISIADQILSLRK
jgi:DNA-binding Lrp family transcriptional regulator